MSQRELGQAVEYSEEQISSIERGRRTPQPDFLVTVDELLGRGGLLALLGEDVERARPGGRCGIRSGFGITRSWRHRRSRSVSTAR
ncbi:helix-turn-helix domain-containing protein [Streptomyces malaysiensis]|uniref:helix-turn-helix domain-containing protein n=1 Tax=Streptomyces malaysiensis TaxID=92644 RepID=UPI003719F61A